MLVNRCPSCSKPVAEKDEACPFCGKDFSTPAAPRKLFTPPPDAAAAPAPPPPVRPAQEPPPPPPESVPPSVYYERPVVVPPPAALPPKEESLIPPVVLYSAAALLVAAGFWMLHRPSPAPPAVEAAAPVAAGKDSLIVEKAPSAPDPAPEPAALPETAVRAPGPKRAPSSRPRPAPPRTQPPPPEEPPIIAAGHAARPAELRVHGTVFDLATLQPIPDVEIIFTDPVNGQRSATGTDAEGRFRARLAINDSGYDMAVSHPDYDSKYLIDEGSALRGLPLAKRIETAVAETRTLQSKMLLPSHDEKIRRDIMLIPLKLPTE